MSSRPSPLDLMDDLERQLDAEEFSLVNPSSTSSSTRRSVRGESSITPSSARLSSTRSAGGGEGDVVGGGSSALWPVVLIEEGDLDSLCLGVVGSGSRFCVAHKLAGFDHCGIESHCKGKYSAIANAYYGPGGKVNNRPMARGDPVVLKATVPRQTRVEFASSQDTISGWIHRLVDAQHPAPELDAFDAELEDSLNLKEEGEGESKDNLALADTSSNFSEGEISLLGMEEFDLALDEVAIGSLVEGDKIKSWAPTAQAHQSAIGTLLQAIQTIGDKVPKVIQKVDCDYRGAVLAAAASIRELNLDNTKLTELMGDLAGLVADHGTLAGAVQEAMEGVTESANISSDLKTDIQAATDAINDAKSKWESSSNRVLRILTKMAGKHTDRCVAIEGRLADLEDAQQGPGQDGPNARTHQEQTPEEMIQDMLDGISPRGQPGATTLTPPRVFNKGADVNADTVFGQVELGGSTVNLTMNTLFDLFKKLEAKQDIQLDRSKCQGVIFRRLAFASEMEFIRWYITLNPSGRGMAGFVDLTTMWVYASMEQVSTTDFLQMYHKSVSTGFSGNVETQYINALNNRYPAPFVGNTDIVLATQRIKAFESVDVWRGNGMGDGTKERLIEALRMAGARHRTYCEDNLPVGDLRDHAIRSGEFTVEFFQAFVVHIDDEINMLLSFGLDEKKIMVLNSNQFVQICDELFIFHQHAINADASNKAAAACRYAWVSLQALQKMGEYMQAKFRNHPAITGARVRFLICQQADSSPSGLQKKMDTIDGKFADYQKSVNKVDTKLEDIIRVNKLKKKDK